MKKFLKYTFLFFLAVGICIAAAGGTYLYKLNSELPSIDDLKDFKYKQPTIIYDNKGRIIAELGAERRYIVPMEKIPDAIKQAVVAVEDSRFYNHGGVDIIGIFRAFVTNVKAGRVVEGGSTLTQQLVKIIYLTPERKLKRKVKEAILAYKLDNNMTKDEILHLYVNQVYFGRGSYGVEAAAQNYFGKHVWELTLGEAALIAGLPKAPGNYAPHRHKDRAIKRMKHVLYRMYEEGYITEEQYLVAKDEEIEVIEKIKSKLQHAGYFVDYVIKELGPYFNENEIRDKGLRIYTTLDLDFQSVAEAAVRKNLINISRRQGYFGTLGNEKEVTYEKLASKYEYLTDYGFMVAKVDKVDRTTAKISIGDLKSELILKKNRWAKPYQSTLWKLDDFRKIMNDGDFIFVEKRSDKDFRLHQLPKIEGALLSIKDTGEVVAMVGGFDYNKSMFNRAIQSKRQVGSLFKPIVYSTAFENDYSVVSTVYDAPIIMEMGNDEGGYWKPENFEKSFYGFTTLKKALTKSRNVVTIKLAQKLGVKRIKTQAEKFGITSDLANDLSISIGSGAISLKEMVRAYTAFVNLGEYQPLFAITNITDSDNKTLYEFESPERVRAISSTTADIMSNLLINVVENGTGRKAKKIGRIIGGKTGTTNDYRDAWFMGVMPNLITGSWVGFDDFRTIGKLETGARTALPAWIDYTTKIVQHLDFKEFAVSDNLTYYKVDTVSNQISDSYSDNFTFEPFTDKEDLSKIKTIN